jgi:hypothetical protein
MIFFVQNAHGKIPAPDEVTAAPTLLLRQHVGSSMGMHSKKNTTPG